MTGDFLIFPEHCPNHGKKAQRYWAEPAGSSRLSPGDASRRPTTGAHVEASQTGRTRTRLPSPIAGDCAQTAALGSSTRTRSPAGKPAGHCQASSRKGDELVAARAGPSAYRLLWRVGPRLA